MFKKNKTTINSSWSVSISTTFHHHFHVLNFQVHDHLRLISYLLWWCFPNPSEKFSYSQIGSSTPGIWGETPPPRYQLQICGKKTLGFASCNSSAEDGNVVLSTSANLRRWRYGFHADPGLWRYLTMWYVSWYFEILRCRCFMTLYCFCLLIMTMMETNSWI